MAHKIVSSPSTNILVDEPDKLKINEKKKQNKWMEINGFCGFVWYNRFYFKKCVKIVKRNKKMDTFSI